MTNTFDIHGFAYMLHWRLFGSWLEANYHLEPRVVLDLVPVLLDNQEVVTALDWLVMLRDSAQWLLPERCESLHP